MLTEHNRQHWWNHRCLLILEDRRAKVHARVFHQHRLRVPQCTELLRVLCHVQSLEPKEEQERQGGRVDGV